MDVSNCARHIRQKNGGFKAEDEGRLGNASTLDQNGCRKNVGALLKQELIKQEADQLSRQYQASFELV